MSDWHGLSVTSTHSIFVFFCQRYGSNYQLNQCRHFSMHLHSSSIYGYNNNTIQLSVSEMMVSFIHSSSCWPAFAWLPIQWGASIEEDAQFNVFRWSIHHAWVSLEECLLMPFIISNLILCQDASLLVTTKLCKTTKDSGLFANFDGEIFQ